MFDKITNSDYASKGIRNLPDVPALQNGVMQRKCDELTIDVVIPKFNALCDDVAEMNVNKADLVEVQQIEADIQDINRDKADKTEVQAVANDVETLSTTKANQTTVDSLTTLVNSKASQTEVDTLTTTVNSKVSQTDFDTLNAKVVPATDNTLGLVMADGETTTIRNGKIIAIGGGDSRQADWIQTDDTRPDYIKNKPTIPHADGTTITMDDDGTLHGSAEIDIDTETPTFTEASSVANIESAETISTLFGKIKKVFSTLFSIGVVAEDTLSTESAETRDADTLGGRYTATILDSYISGENVEDYANVEPPIIDADKLGGLYSASDITTMQNNISTLSNNLNKLNKHSICYQIRVSDYDSNIALGMAPLGATSGVVKKIMPLGEANVDVNYNVVISSVYGSAYFDILLSETSIRDKIKKYSTMAYVEWNY